ncbi:MAG: hypothetical protein QM655_05560 [Nocardioidaceae bacterium]
MSTALRVLRAGHATVQDLGRPGFAALGIACGGAADQHAARTANALVGNPDTAPLVEITASDFTLRADRDVLVAVTGAADVVLVARGVCPAWELLPVRAGSEVHLPAPTAGLRSYLAVNGELSAARTLGSAAPDPLLGFTQTIAEGDVLHLTSRLDRVPTDPLPIFRLGVSPPAYAVAGVSTVAITPGPEHELLGDPRQLGETFGVMPDSNQVGLRLDGPELRLDRYAETLSRGVPVGAVEIPPTGGVIVLLRGRLVTAGYPVVAVATTTSLDVLGQLRPADRLRFAPTTVEAAVAELRAQRQAHAALAGRVRNALSARGLGHLVHPGHASRAASLGSPIGA